MLIFELNQENVDLSRTEVEVFLGIKLDPLIGSLFTTSGSLLENYDFDLSILSRLAYTKNVYDVILDMTKIDLKLIGAKIESSYRVDLKNYNSKWSVDFMSLANDIYKNVDNPVVSLKNPNNNYIIFAFESNFLFTRRIYENIDHPKLRRAHLRKWNHPTSLNPKQARVMINLGTKKEFIDPFCGAGGILLEGGLMGLRVRGQDISKAMIGRSRENLESFDVEADLKIENALDLNLKTEAIITDLPFGKNSSISENMRNLMEKFFIQIQDLTEIAVVGYIDGMDMSGILSKSKWYEFISFDIYVHKSMTRKISILKKK